MLSRYSSRSFRSGIFRHHRCQLGDRNVAVVAGRVRMAHADAAAAQQAVWHHAHRPRLADHRDRPVHGWRFDVHGGKRQDRAAAEVGQPLGVGPDDAHAAGVRGIAHALFLGLAFDRIGLAEAGSHHHRGLHAALGALLDRFDGRVACQRDDRRLRRFRQIRQRGIGLVSLDLRTLRVDRDKPCPCNRWRDR